MTEDEYWQGEFEDDGEFGDTFLSDEENDEDINVVIIPKFEYDVDEVLKGYVKILKKCKSTDEAVAIMYELYNQIKLITIIEIEQEELQVKAHNLEVLMEQVVIR